MVRQAKPRHSLCRAQPGIPQTRRADGDCLAARPLQQHQRRTLRAYISSHCRILAVVGLDNNTFKPHTGTKTSLLFVQKWNDDPAAGLLCPRVDDYPIFFATSHQSGKDNSGNYIYRTDDLGNRVLDSHGHLIIEHDLNDIATAFVLFAKEQGFPFWKDVDRPF
jgi:type I restriction enzyme M protein